VDTYNLTSTIALPDEGHGVFGGIASFQDAAELARDLKRKARSFYGTAGPAFISGLSRDLVQTRERLKVLSNQFSATMLQSLPEIAQADGQVQRSLGHFSLIYAAGALACELAVLPFSATIIRDALLQAFEEWVSLRGGLGSFEEERALAAIREFIELHVSRFQSETPSAGVQFEKNGHSYYAFLPGVWKNEVCQGQDARAVAKIALKHGFLEPECDALGHVTNLQRKVPLDGCRVRAYCIKATILGEEADTQNRQTPQQPFEDEFLSSVASFLN